MKVITRSRTNSSLGVAQFKSNYRRVEGRGNMAYGQMLFHPGNCINSKKPFARACRECVEKCPHQAISELHEINLQLCSECGVCMAVCPSDGVVDRALAGLHDYLFQAEEIVLNCPAAEPEGWEISCLGMLDRDLWLTLLVLASGKKVKLLTGRCAQCEDRQACLMSVSLFKEIHAQWPEHPAIEIVVKPEQVGSVERNLPKNPGMDAESGLRNWRELGRKKVEELLPGLAMETTYNIPLTRRWLAEALEITPRLKIPFMALTVSAECTSCGVCAAICPQGSLTKREKGQVLQLVLEPLECVQCGRCAEICQPKAMTFEVKALSVDVLKGKILLHEGQPRYCSNCGRQIFHNSEPALCLACATRDPDRHDVLL